MSNVVHLIEQFGLDRCGFLTITFDPREGILTFKEAQRRLNNFLRRVLGPLFPIRIKVLEFQKNGNPHYHLLVVCEGDIREGFDFDFYDDMVHWSKHLRNFGVERPKGSLGRNPLLVSLHDRLNGTRGNYGIGRMELVPIRTCAQAVGYYIGGYMAKGVPERTTEHKGARFVSYSQGFDRLYKGAFSWVDQGREWRRKLEFWAAKHGCDCIEAVTALFGPSWGYTHREAIMATEVPPEVVLGQDTPISITVCDIPFGEAAVAVASEAPIESGSTGPDVLSPPSVPPRSYVLRSRSGQDTGSFMRVMGHQACRLLEDDLWREVKPRRRGRVGFDCQLEE
jgi:hypothetical protein